MAAVASDLLERIDRLFDPDPEVAVGSTGDRHLRWMLGQVVEKSDVFPVDKLGRWLGFVQGVLAARGLLDVSEERDRTRGTFREAYRLDGVEVPKSLGPEGDGLATGGHVRVEGFRVGDRVQFHQTPGEVGTVKAVVNGKPVVDWDDGRIGNKPIPPVLLELVPDPKSFTRKQGGN
jgi:hypothetical protein